MRKFQCDNCHKIFIAEGKKIEKINPIYGATWKWQAKHDCGIICDEYYLPEVKIKKKKRTRCAKNCLSCPFKL